MSEPKAATSACGAPEVRKQASSPYAAGGGGSTFGHRVAAIYVAHGLLGEGRTETDDLPVMRVEFQTNPEHDVDDLLVIAGTGGDEVRLSVAARRAPKFVTSHVKTRELVASLMLEVEAAGDDERARVVVAVADWKAEYEQVQQLAELARGNADEGAFYTQLHTERRWDGKARDRYGYLKSLVSDGRLSTPTEDNARLLTWRLLRRLWVVQFRVEAADESDWSQIANSLNRLVREGLTGARLRDRLAVCCTQFDSLGTAVDMRVVRREVHTLLKATAIRREPGWAVLDSMKRHAYEAVRYTLGPDSDGGASVTINRAKLHVQLADTLLNNGANSQAVIVSGDSGTGKSSLVSSVVKSLEAEKAESFEALVVNLRRLPGSVPELTSVLGRGLREFLEDLSAPSRVLVVDGADGALEGQGPLLAEIASEARHANVGLVVVTADTAVEFVTDQVKRSYNDPRPFTVPVLDDAEIATIAAGIPQMVGLLRDLPEQSLLRRLVVLDLLSRTGLTLGSSMTDWACLEVVWKGLVRRNESAEFGSPEARERALLALVEDELELPDVARQHPSPDHAAVDALRRDHLLAPSSVYDSRPQFAHDEVRRYATALTLFRARDITGMLKRAGVPRWAMSAAQLACHGQFVRGNADPSTAFTQAAAAFMTVGIEHGARWADVPIEAALESPQAFEYLKSVQPGAASAFAPGLEDVMRVVEQRHTVNGLTEVQCGEAVVRVLLEQDDAPWLLSERAFETTAGWLQSMIVANEPTGNITREVLRSKLLAYWTAHQTSAPPTREGLDVPLTVDSGAVSRNLGQRGRRRRNLDYRLRQEKFVELLALLGLDIDDDIERCLTEIADDAPEYLAPAVDSPLSARGIAQHSINLLVKLVEEYYIDNTPNSWGFRDRGIRRHQGRWHHSPPFAALYFGAFWSLFNYADPVQSAALLNKILNHAARRQVENLSKRREYGSAPAGDDFESYTVSLRISGEARNYMGDAQMWAWYRGASSGPYPCMSALQAMERIIDGWLERGASISRVVEVLLDGCKNLAVPALLVGIMVRHLGKADGVIDSFLREPLVWHLEFERTVQEQMGLRGAPSDGLVNAERRTWTFRDVCMVMVLGGDERRREELRRLGTELLAAGQEVGMADDVANWAICLDASRFQVRSENEQLVVEVSPPEELAKSQAERAREHERNSNVLRIQNRYWAALRNVGTGYVPPTGEEIAADLAQVKDLLESPSAFTASDPTRGAAHVASTAIRYAANGEPAAFGENAAYTVGLITTIASGFEDCEDGTDDEQVFDFGADRAVATALPCLLLPVLETALTDAGFTRIQVNTAALAVASKSSLETRLHLARGCDSVWRASCTGEPCIHTIAFKWVTEAARGTEIGPWDAEGQTRTRVRIDGDLTERLADLDGDSIDTPVLDAAIRSYGAAAAEGCCVSKQAAEQLAVLIQAQRKGMLVQNESGWSVDDREAQSLVTARALLHTSSGGADRDALVGHLTALRGNAFLLSNFLHQLSAAGAETAALAESARGVWPTVMKHVMTFADTEPNPFIEHSWGEWALAALIPQPLVWSNGLFNETDANPIDWVVPEELLEAIPEWVQLAHGSRRCLNDLISLIRRLSIREQVELSLRWVADICVRERNVGVYRARLLDEWLVELHPHTEAFGHLHEWQRLVDHLVVAGNQRLARYSV
ncbi:hypothetical protein [Streptosporangium sp. NBC_01469]|uniref:hypothetical protein n=1 Tax=Streptosporangium sp. NBC_01469 TaxID=2903898 RepID=UPI002E2E3108|nr:hypothetical protein [Streptosporangium sp. NBC_01469]